MPTLGLPTSGELIRAYREHACTHCGRSAGYWCETRSGKEMSGLHKVRVRAAIEAAAVAEVAGSLNEILGHARRPDRLAPPTRKMFERGNRALTNYRAAGGEVA